MKVDNIDFSVKRAKFMDKKTWIEQSLILFPKIEHEKRREYLAKIHDDCCKEYDRMNAKPKPKQEIKD